jgi:hypothetical protein
LVYNPTDYSKDAGKMLTIVELPEYRRKIGSKLTLEENASLISRLAKHPDDGVLIKGTGGIRKLRWAAKGKGKSGSVRVIYYFYNSSLPLFLLTLFGKDEKSNLSQAEVNELARLVILLRQNYGDFT